MKQYTRIFAGFRHEERLLYHERDCNADQMCIRDRGKHDDLPESAFLFVGTIDEAVAKAKKGEHS